MSNAEARRLAGSVFDQKKSIRLGLPPRVAVMYDKDL
jgi:hypothetical protein